MKRLSLVIAVAITVVPAGEAWAGWSPARNLPQTGDLVPTPVATQGLGTEVVGYESRGNGYLAGVAGGGLRQPLLVQRKNFDVTVDFDVATTRSGRTVAAWIWYDASEEDPEARFECCERAVATVYRRGKRPWAQVLSAPGVDVRDIDVATGPGGLTVVAWQVVGGEIYAAVARGSGRLRVTRLAPQRIAFGLHVDAAVDAHGRAIVTWGEGGIDRPWKFTAARSDRRGRFGAPRTVGAFSHPDASIDFFEILTSPDGSQTVVWSESSPADEYPMWTMRRPSRGDYGPPRRLTRDSGDARAAAIGPRGDAIAVWTRDSRTYLARRDRGAFAFGGPRPVMASVADVAAGVDARGRTVLVYSSHGRVATRRGDLRRAVELSQRGRGVQCERPQVSVAPGGDALASWLCSRSFFSRPQVSVFRP